MPHWLLTPVAGGEPHIARTRRGKRPADEGYDESLFTVARLRRAPQTGERVIDGKVRQCTELQAAQERRQRIAAIGFDAWLQERVIEIVEERLKQAAQPA